MTRKSITSGFKNKIRLAICVPIKSTHTTTEQRILETMLLDNVYIAILTLTSEYRGTVTNLQAPFFSGTVDWELHMPSASTSLLGNPPCPLQSSKQL